MSDHIDERWREKYYDKCTELNTAEVENEKLKAQLQMTNSNWPHEKKLHDYCDNLRKALSEARDFIDEATRRDCICNAAWSGRDEAEYRAHGCPSCYCGDTVTKITSVLSQGEE